MINEDFKYDVRVRRRLLSEGQLSEAELKDHVNSLADVEDNSEPLVLDAPDEEVEETVEATDNFESPAPTPGFEMPIAPNPVAAAPAVGVVSEVEPNFARPPQTFTAPVAEPQPVTVETPAPVAPSPVESDGPATPTLPGTQGSEEPSGL